MTTAAQTPHNNLLRYPPQRPGLILNGQPPAREQAPARSAAPIVALIPAFNEERFIGSLVLAVRPYVDVVVVVDDGSSDGTAEIARKAGATVISHEQNRGKAAGVNTGFEYVRQLGARAMVMLDGDGQHRAQDIPTVLAPVVAGSADIVVGSRFLEVKSKIPVYRQIGQHSLTLATNLASGVSVSDSQSGYRAFSTAAIGALSFSKGGFSIESEMQFLAREHNLRVVEAPIHVVYCERAKRNPFKHGMQVVDGIVTLTGQVRPLLYFGLSGVITFLCGLLFGLYVVHLFSQSHTLAIGYALVTVLLCVVGVMLFFAGIILHATRAMFCDLRRSVVERLPYSEVS
jgi:glycosyltransferase involved in cell wall biosynthesis